MEVQVDAPQGADAEVWARIQRPAMLHFLQTGVALGKPSGARPGSLSAEVLARVESGEGMPAEAAELVLAHPASRYAAALRQALGEYYYQRKNYQFMQSLVAPGWAKWVRQGDGYRLEAIVAAAEK